MPDSPQEEKRDRFDFRGGTIEKYIIAEYLDTMLHRFLTPGIFSINDAETSKLMADSKAFENAVNLGRVSAIKMMRADLTYNLIELTKEESDKMPLTGYYH